MNTNCPECGDHLDNGICNQCVAEDMLKQYNPPKEMIDPNILAPNLELALHHAILHATQMGLGRSSMVQAWQANLNAMLAGKQLVVRYEQFSIQEKTHD